MTEKPMATRWDDGMAHGARLRRRRRAPVRRQAEPPQRDAAAAQARGRRAAASAASTWSTSTCSGRGRRATTTARAWRGTWEFDGGAFMNQASHYVDLLDWLIGPVESVQAYTATLARDIEVEDTGVIGAALAHRRAGLDQRHDARPTRRTSKARSPSSARRARCASAAWRSTRSSTGSSPSRDPRTTQVARRELRRPPRSTASAIRCTTTTSSRRCAARPQPETDGREGLQVARSADRGLPVARATACASACRWSY